MNSINPSELPPPQSASVSANQATTRGSILSLVARTILALALLVGAWLIGSRSTLARSPTPPAPITGQTLPELWRLTPTGPDAVLCATATWINPTDNPEPDASISVNLWKDSTHKIINTPLGKLDFGNGITATTFCTDIYHPRASGRSFCLDSGFFSDWRVAWLVTHYPPTPDNAAQQAARQAAVWRFTDGWVLDQDDPTLYNEAYDAAVRDAYNAILAAIPLSPPAEYQPGNVQMVIEPAFSVGFLPTQPTVDLSVRLTKGTAPLANYTVTLTTTFGALDRTTALTDDRGEATFVLTGTTAGVAAITATAQIDLPAGSRFIDQADPDAWQRLVLGQMARVAAEAHATRRWLDADNLIIAHKFEDKDFDGVQEADEPDLAGWEFILTTPAGSHTATTDSDGNAYFPDAISLNGLYTLTETVQAGWLNSTPLSQARERSDTDPWTRWQADFGNARYAIITVRKFLDSDGNGTWDEGQEPPLGGWQFALYRWNGTDWAQHRGGTTDSAGRLTFTDLAAGQYRVVEQLDNHPGYTNTTPLAVEVALGFPAQQTVDFGNRGALTINGSKYNDLNANGVRDADEPGLPGWMLTLTGGPHNVTITVTTDGSGAYRFDNLEPGTYTVGEAQQPGWAQTQPADDAPYVVVLADQSLAGLDFGNMQLPTSTPTATPTSTPTATPTPTATSTPTSTPTATPTPTPTSTPTPTATSTPTSTPTATPTPTPTSTPTPTATPTATSTPTPALGCITGVVRDELHIGLAGWTIRARPRDAASPILTTVTDGSGAFRFDELTPGVWTIWEEMQPGWAPVTPASFEVTVTSEPACAEAAFKNRQACALDLFENDDTPADASLIAVNGAAQKHTLEPPTDVDWVKFDATAGSVYTITTAALLGVTDTYMELYAPDGATKLADNDDMAPGNLASQIIWTAPADGRYFIYVRDYYQTGARGCLGYELSIQTRHTVYLPIIVNPAPAPTATITPTPTATASPSATPTATATRTPTATPTVTRTPSPMPTPLPPPVITGLSHPKGLGVNLNSHALYVASRNNHMVYRVNPLLGQVTHTIPVGREPFGVAVNTLTNKVYVANFLGNTVSVINELSASVATTITLAGFGEPTYVAINETTNRIYVPLHRDGRLAVINGATDSLLTTVEACAGAFGVAVDPISDRVYVSCRDAQIIRVINGATNQVLWDETIYTQGMPYALGMDPMLGQLYASFTADPNDRLAPQHVLVYRVPAILPQPHRIIAVKPGGPDGGGGIVANLRTHRVFVTNSLDDSVTVFDGNTLTVVDTVPVGDNPLGVAVDSALGYAYVGNRASNNISVIPDW